MSLPNDLNQFAFGILNINKENSFKMNSFSFNESKEENYFEPGFSCLNNEKSNSLHEENHFNEKENSSDLFIYPKKDDKYLNDDFDNNSLNSKKITDEKNNFSINLNENDINKLKSLFDLKKNDSSILKGNDSYSFMFISKTLNEPKKDSKNIFTIDHKEEDLTVKIQLGPDRYRKEDNDNIRTKIKRKFYNTFLRNKLNEILKNIGSKKYFEKFPQNFVKDVSRKRNKEIFDMKLFEIFEKNELYVGEKDSGLEKYFHNLSVIQNEEIMNNEEFKKISNKRICELFDEYLKEKEFKLEKNKNLNNEYVKKYNNLAEHLNEFFSKE